MAELKASEVVRFLAKPDLSKSVILIYGPDAGLVSETADRLADKSGVDLSDPFCSLRIDADVMAGETSRLAEEAHTIAMFGGKRLIRISGTTRKDLVRAVQPVLDTPPVDAMIIIEAGDLKKSTGLRKLVEKHPQGLAIPCYQDNDAAINQLIDQEITQKGLKLDDETRRMLRGLLGADRLISRSELAKLALYCDEKDEVTLEDVRSVVGDASKLVLDDVVDATASGDPENLEIFLPRAIQAGNSPDMIVSATLRHFQMLQAARSKFERDRQPASAILATLRPPIHFSRKNKVGTAISTWPVSRIAHALSRLDKAMFECRRNSGISASLAGTALLALALEARSLRKR